MGIGASVFLLAVGAVLTFAVETDSTEGINVDNVGIILMVVGALGLVIFALVWGPRTRRPAPSLTVVERRPAEPVVHVQERVVVDRTPVVEREPIVERRIYE